MYKITLKKPNLDSVRGLILCKQGTGVGPVGYAQIAFILIESVSGLAKSLYRSYFCRSYFKYVSL